MRCQAEIRQVERIIAALKVCDAVEHNPEGWGGSMAVSLARTIRKELLTDPVGVRYVLVRADDLAAAVACVDDVDRGASPLDVQFDDGLSDALAVVRPDGRTMTWTARVIGRDVAPREGDALIAVPPALAVQPTFTCPGRDLPQPKGAPPEGYVACYRAGHDCPPAVALVEETETHRHTEYRCPCCGDFKGAQGIPKEWLT